MVKKMISLFERFLVRISKDGFSNYVEKLHSNCTVFSDLGISDVSPIFDCECITGGQNNFIRKKRDSMKKGEKNCGNHIYRRTYGVEVLEVTIVPEPSLRISWKCLSTKTSGMMNIENCSKLCKYYYL